MARVMCMSATALALIIAASTTLAAPRPGRGQGAYAVGIVPDSSWLRADMMLVNFEKNDTDDKVTAGRMLLQAGLTVSNKVTLTLAAPVSFAIVDEDAGDDAAVLGNVALGLTTVTGESASGRSALAAKIYLPSLRQFDTMDDMGADFSALAGHMYELGYYMPQTLTRRVDFQHQVRGDGVTLNLEFGGDLLLPAGSEPLVDDEKSFLGSAERNDETEGFLHGGLNVAVHASPTVDLFLEFAFTRFTYYSGDEDRVDKDMYMYIGPGLHFFGESASGDLYFILPSGGDLEDVLDAVYGFKVTALF